MPNNYYERLSEMNPGELADGLAIEQEFDAIGRGFAKLPNPHRDGRGFEGATRVGDPVEETDAVNLGTLEKLNLPIYRKKITTDDWNTITDAGIYDVVNASGANKAPGHPYGVLNVYKFNGTVTQVYYPDVSGKFVIAKRTCPNISEQLWQDWDGAIPVKNVVGLVNNGSIFESGKNSNGSWIKFADGSFEQNFYCNVPPVAIYQGFSVTKLYPSDGFIAPPMISWSVASIGPGGSGSVSGLGELQRVGARTDQSTNIEFTFIGYTYKEAITQSVNINVRATGRWK